MPRPQVEISEAHPPEAVTDRKPTPATVKRKESTLLAEARKLYRLDMNNRLVRSPRTEDDLKDQEERTLDAALNYAAALDQLTGGFTV